MVNCRDSSFRVGSKTDLAHVLLRRLGTICLTDVCLSFLFWEWGWHWSILFKTSPILSKPHTRINCYPYSLKLHPSKSHMIYSFLSNSIAMTPSLAFTLSFLCYSSCQTADIPVYKLFMYNLYWRHQQKSIQKKKLTSEYHHPQLPTN